MEPQSEQLERQQLEHLTTTELVQHALQEARLLARAEVLHAKKELQQQVHAARTAGILLGAAGVLALVALAVLFATLGVALPLPEWLGLLLVGLFLVVVAAVLGGVGWSRLPKQPLRHTQERLKTDLFQAREALQP